MKHVILNDSNPPQYAAANAVNKMPLTMPVGDLSDRQFDGAFNDTPGGTKDQLAFQTALKRINQYLNQGHYEIAARYTNEHYSSFSSEALNHIQTKFYTHANALERRNAKAEALRLYTAATSVFDDLRTWLHVSQLAINLQEWQPAFAATFRASLLQNDPVALEKLQDELVTIASNYRTVLEKNGNQLAVHGIYDELYKAHPGYPRFQLELAYSHLRLEQHTQARALLVPLQYDVLFGQLSQNVLAKLDAGRLNMPDNTRLQSTSAGLPSSNVNDVVVPLTRLGTNLLAEVTLNQYNTSLLLDTGASITAIDTRLINQLNLPPIGNTIQISTANGIRAAQLYVAENLKLGSLRFKNHIVAGIELGSGPRFAGLLGTDLLNSIGHDYTYVIDNKQSALIFRPVSVQ